MQPDFGDWAGIWRSTLAIHLLAARSIQVARNGDHADGGGLFLRVTASGASWVWRYTGPDGRRREMGLGSAERATLTTCGAALEQARAEVQRQRALLAQRIDPIAKRQADRAAAAATTQAAKAEAKREQDTLARVARRYHAEVIEPQRTTKHSAQWIASLEQNVPPELWQSPIDTIGAPALLEALAALQMRVPVTASRVRQRLEVIFDDAQFREQCSTNPAKLVRRKLAERPVLRKKGNFAALHYSRVPTFMASLRLQAGTAARALEFGVLCAARTGEILGSRFDEVDAEAGVWRVPATRMKGGEEHSVFLSSRALEIIDAQRVTGSAYVFPSPIDNGKPMSNMAMLTVLRRMKVAAETTVHGICRASFSSWANECAVARPDVIEAALAHREQDRVRSAYNRASFDNERRALLARWEEYCVGKQVQVASEIAMGEVLHLSTNQPSKDLRAAQSLRA
jgi:integrase